MQICKSVTNIKSIRYFNELAANFNSVHKNKYDYSKVIFINSRTKIKIICPIHGEFEQIPHSHKLGVGCKQCGISRTSKKVKLPLVVFLERATKIHNSFYTYGKIAYTGARSKVIITCPIHGDFEQTPHSHMNGSGCRKCAFHKNKDVRRSTKEKFIQKAIDINKDYYDYSKVIYEVTDKPVTIICPLHGEFKQTPHDHISKQAGCPKCSVYGFKKDKPAILYYIKITKDNEEYYKIGVTNNSLKTRFKKDMKYITTIKIKSFGTGEEAYLEEQSIIKKYYASRYTGKCILSTNGNTELFTKDVLNLDNKNKG